MNLYTCLFAVFFGSTCISQNIEFKGTITSEGAPVSFANVYFENSSIGTQTNEKGEFEFRKIPEGRRKLIISAIGYKTVEHPLSGSEKKPIIQNFNLPVSAGLLSEVLIIDQQTGLTRRTPYNVSTINMTGIENKGNPNGMMGVLREVPGVYGAEFGQGIVKPFIRGLGFSRIVTIYQGNKLENHQWGADHGLGINDLGIRQVDVIKGPASVLYGSGALGGVLLAKDDEFYMDRNQLSGNIGTTYNSISNGIRTYASLGKTFKNNFFLATDLAYENHADYKNGNGRIIGNSRFNTKTLRLHTGIEKENFQNKLSLTYNHQNLGIIIDEEMDDSQSLSTTRNDRKMQLPYQKVEDYLISYNQNTTGEKLETSFHLSHHLNKRNEIELTEDRVDLGLIQNHTFYNARLSLSSGKFKHSLGTQGSFLQNKNLENARDFLIPDAQVFENGIYYLSSFEMDTYFFQGAFRYDYRKVTADASADYLIDDDFILPGNPENRKLSRSFAGYTGSLGVTKKFGENHRLKLNFSTGFRAPDLAELFSNGPHPGTSRFEKGNENFDREQSLQADASYTYRKKRFQGTVSAFGSQIDNYIFFSATKDSREENLELWEYQQADVQFYGAEFELRHSWLRGDRLETKISGAFVRATERENNNNLTFIPPDNYNVETGYYALPDRSLYVFSNFRIIADQNRTGLNEESTAGYELLNLGASKKFQLKDPDQSMTLGLTIHNTLDKTYVDHMSILRAFHVSSPGRNMMVNLKYNF